MLLLDKMLGIWMCSVHSFENSWIPSLARTSSLRICTGSQVSLFFIFEKTLQSPSGGSTDTSNFIVSLPGGSAFAANYDYDTQLTSSCTTSGLTIDKSNYWMPQSAEPFASETQLQY